MRLLAITLLALSGCANTTHTTGWMHVSIPSETHDTPLDMVCQGMRYERERVEVSGNLCYEPQLEYDFFVGGVSYVW